MIKASDLRQGNLLNARYHNNTEPSGGGFFWSPVVVWSINGDLETITTKHGEDIPISEERLQPIPLTAEWQQRLGVRQLGMNKFEHLDTGFDLSSACEIKWVHQIQNIFFCASGNELTIKEKQA